MGMVPGDLKVTRVNPVYKGGSKNHLKNYRPISVLPIFSRLFEGALNDRLVNFVNKRYVITGAPYGFQKGNSTKMALKKHQGYNRRLYRKQTIYLSVNIRF